MKYTNQYPNTNRLPLGAMLVAGFAAALAVWCIWFAAPLPWIQLNEPLALTLVGLAWLGTIAAILRQVAPRNHAVAGIGAGLVTALTCLIPLLSRMRPSAAAASPIGSDLPPGAGLIVAVFLIAGATLGAAAAALARFTGGDGPHLSNRPQPWLARFAIVAAVAMAPLLFLGGLVTSTDSGMAVPDWPTTFGAQMFFYPMGSQTDPDVYLEHTHRLFGTLVGLTSLILMVWALTVERWRWAGKVAVVVFVLVCLQGLLGGARVRIETALGGDNLDAAASWGRRLAMLHGVLAQLVFGGAVALAVYLSPTYQRGAADEPVDLRHARRLKALSIALLHALILQLLLGAMTRHFRSTNHALWAHAAFSVIVFGLAAVAGFAASSLPKSAGPGPRAMRRSGTVLIVVVVLQFLLGWGAFLVRGQGIKATTVLESLVRTAHQANGALLLAVATLGFVWSRWLWRGIRTQPPPEQAAVPAQAIGSPA